MQLDRPPPPFWPWRWKHLVGQAMRWARQAQRFLRKPLEPMIDKCKKSAVAAQGSKRKVKPKPTYSGECSHNHIKRTGNRHGSYAQCLDCKIKWRWNKELDGWEHFTAASSSSPLPLPSSATVLDHSWAPPSGHQGYADDQLPGPRPRDQRGRL